MSKKTLDNTSVNTIDSDFIESFLLAVHHAMA